MVISQAEYRIQNTEGRIQNTEYRRQNTEDRGQRSEDRRQKAQQHCHSRMLFYVKKQAPFFILMKITSNYFIIIFITFFLTTFF